MKNIKLVLSITLLLTNSISFSANSSPTKSKNETQKTLSEETKHEKTHFTCAPYPMCAGTDSQVAKLFFEYLFLKPQIDAETSQPTTKD